MKNPIEWLLDRWFKKYWESILESQRQQSVILGIVEIIPHQLDSLKTLNKRLLSGLKDNYRQITASIQCVEQQVIPRLNEIKETELEHYKELRQRIEDTNVTARSTNELVKEMHLMLSEFYDRFKKRFPD